MVSTIDRFIILFILSSKNRRETRMGQINGSSVEAAGSMTAEAKVTPSSLCFQFALLIAFFLHFVQWY